MTTDNRIIEKGISDIVGCLTDPLLVFPGGWGDSLPDWIKSTITLERLVGEMKSLKGEKPTGTDAEACAYLYTASLTFPFDHDWTQIYLYIATNVYENWRAKESGVTMPADIRVDKLNEEQMRDLNRLKDWLYEHRVRVRQDRDRAARRERKEAEKVEKELRQPALFQF